MTSKLISQEQVSEIFQGQDAINKKAGGDDWATKGLPFYVAASAELGEALAYLESEWNWWKKVPAVSSIQVWLEVVDAFHFSISDHLDMPPSEAASMLNHGFTALDSVPPGEREAGLTKHSAISNLMSSVFQGNVEEVFFGFGVLSNLFGYGPIGIYQWYCAKNALNLLRQNYGYKTGEYSKHWEPGVEDNKFLEDIVVAMDPATISIPLVYEKLEAVYLSKRPSSE